MERSTWWRSGGFEEDPAHPALYRIHCMASLLPSGTSALGVPGPPLPSPTALR